MFVQGGDEDIDDDEANEAVEGMRKRVKTSERTDVPTDVKAGRGRDTPYRWREQVCTRLAENLW